jgi:hypothetical protein
MDNIVCEITELLSSLSLITISLLFSSSASSISDAKPDDLSPKDIEDSPDDEKLRIEELPEDEDVIDDPPGDDDNIDDVEVVGVVVNVGVYSNCRGEGDIEGPDIPLSSKAISRLLLQEDLLDDVLETEIIV